MANTTTRQSRYTEKVEARAELAGALRDEQYAPRATDAGLLDGDLAPIEDWGKRAARFDRLQHEQLAQQVAENKAFLESRAHVADEMDEVRNRLPAVIGALDDAEATRALAAWLAQLSFSKLRLKVTTREVQGGEAGGATETVREMVERKDWKSWAESNKNFVDALLAEEREAIVSAFAARGMDRERLTALSTDAGALVATLGGAVRSKAVEATAQEAEAAAAQKVAWDRAKRMIRQAVKGVAELEELLKRC